MISAGDFKNGMTIDLDGDICQIIEFQHVKPGKGAAFVRAKIKSLISGSTVERTFRPTEKMPKAHLDRKDMQYLYNDGELFHFMDNSSYEQIAVNKEEIGDNLKFIKENEVIKILSRGERIIGIEPPITVELAVTETEPGFKGDTAGGSVTKPAVVETGAKVNVPLFVNAGDVIKIDTRTGEYMSRA